jgi:endonuclease IV
MIDACGRDERLGLCIDTQHLWASGSTTRASPAPSGW